MKNLLEQLQNICNEFKDENEIIIMKKYGNMAQRYTAIITGKNDYSTPIAKNKKLNNNKNQMIEKEISLFCANLLISVYAKIDQSTKYGIKFFIYTYC